MDSTELDRFQLIIHSLLKELEKSSIYFDQETVPIEPSKALGRLTRMEAIQEKSVNEEMQRKNLRRMEGLHNALHRIEMGTYGVCLKCHKDIAIGRLEILPEAVVCIRCANKKKN